MENIIFNIAQVDFPDHWPTCIGEIQARLNSGNEGALVAGLSYLKRVMEAFEFGTSGSSTMEMLVGNFFQMLEMVINNIGSISTDNQIEVMHLLAKIFHVANNVSPRQILSLTRVSLKFEING